MYINSLLGAEPVYSDSRTVSGKRNEAGRALPVDWQPDDVHISEEARAAYAAMRSEAEAEEFDGPVKQFRDYLEEARGESVSAGDPLEMIEKLKEKLEKLQNELARSAEGSENSKQGRMEAVQAQIDSIVSQISELMSLVEAKA